MLPLGPIYTASLFPPLHQQLIDLLGSRSPDDWHRETVCRGWSVKDIASHLLDTSLRTIALYRDGYVPPDKPQIRSYRELVDFLNQLNNDWVRATRRLSPAVLVDWLDEAGRTADALLMALPPDEPALFPVAWAGQTESPNWFHIAREYTERWHHQQQIRLAVGQEAGILSDALYQPVLDTFLRALPYAYRDTPAPVGTLLRFTIPGMAGGDWWLLRQEAQWTLVEQADQPPATTVSIDREYAWQLVTRNLPGPVRRSGGTAAAEAMSHVQMAGDEALGRPVLAMRSVMM